MFTKNDKFLFYTKKTQIQEDIYLYDIKNKKEIAVTNDKQKEEYEKEYEKDHDSEHEKEHESENERGESERDDDDDDRYEKERRS